MSVDQDWTNVWPTRSIFKQSAVPLPVRQGYVKNQSENGGLPPEKYANTELMKIPNFLHLTPLHIKKQCAAIKSKTQLLNTHALHIRNIKLPMNICRVLHNVASRVEIR